ncbi:phosphocholine-specific phospholipase C [Parapedobacter soli]|uniref:phosphocholine-specific phospholipase C n=1 Tax=Parapedobacter soli TaxID=416955 RepID=UPI0021C6414A|nr:phospholipase C, phosphocholine-specific [Parapedobacter soli]
MESRRSFLKKAALLAGASAAVNTLPQSIRQALAIEAPAGSTYLDAEHVVFLMQENRSFDHCFGSLRGVRGFNDPRAITLPDGLPVWAQTNAKGETYAPFRLDIKNTKATWMGSLPHGWKDMVYARNGGKMDTWLEAKKAGNPEYRTMPLTMGYYDREDIPFYYAFADAFTVCDQHFCSSLTGTSPNRSYFWSGTVREEPRNGESVAHVENGQMVYKDLGWKTYPERLQEAGISWRVYQNELSLPVGFEGEEEDWLANFTNNNLEFHKQYHVRFHPAHRHYMERLAAQLEDEIAVGGDSDEVLEKKKEQLAQLKVDLEKYTAANFEALPEVLQEIHRRALATNTEDPDYHRLETIHYTDDEGDKQVQVPKGDIFYQFRKDVASGNLPTVSWLTAPCNFSDHPGAPWYGAWYVSETLDILTKNPEVWKKTIFILTYDENDGYFDHVPPFVPPHPDGRDGRVASGIDTADEYVTVEQERVRSGNPKSTLESPIGLGFRVPMVVASPWSKGGWVNSEVFDLTSPLQFLEHFLEKKTGKRVIETNISEWRRLVCGDITSVFRPAAGVEVPAVGALGRNAYVERIFSAKSKGLPGNYTLVDKADPQWPEQEPGTKPACALPYNPGVAGRMDNDRKNFVVRFEAAGDMSATKPVGIPFRVHALVPYLPDSAPGRTWNFAVREGEPLSYRWPLAGFAGEAYHLQVHGPNGFFREFKGGVDDPGLQVEVVADPKTGGVNVVCTTDSNLNVLIRDVSYHGGIHRRSGTAEPLRIDLTSTGGWYDIAVEVEGYPGFYQRFAGHVETGKSSITDPLMGKVRS